MRVTKKQRLIVYDMYDGHCAYCGKKIQYKEMQVDHKQSRRKDGENSLSNYNPSCKRCNHYKRSLDIEGYRQYLLTLHERIMKNYIVKVGIDYGIVRINSFDGVFYYEKVGKVDAMDES